MILLALLACGGADPVETPPTPAPAAATTPKPSPAWESKDLALPADLNQQILAVRMATGRARRSPEDACAALEQALVTAPALQQHLVSQHGQSDDVAAFKQAVLRLNDAIPGLVVQNTTAEVDYTELGAAIGQTVESKALVSIGAFLDYRAPWLKGECADLKAALPWISRLGPTLETADACMSEIAVPRITAVMQGWIDAPCWCGTREETVEAANNLDKRLKDTPQLQPLHDDLIQAAKTGPHSCG